MTVGVAAEMHVRVDGLLARDVGHRVVQGALKPAERDQIGAGALDQRQILPPDPYDASPTMRSKAVIASRIASGMREGRPP